MQSANDILFALIEALRPPEKLRPSEVAERYLHLPREAAAMPGRVKLQTAQKQMADSVLERDASGNRVKKVIFATSAQVGKTISLHAIIAWGMLRGGPMLMVRPDANDATSYVRETLNPIIAASHRIREMIGAGDSDSASLKTYPGGSLSIGSAYKSSDLSGKAIRVALGDEVSRWPAMVSTGEGRPEDLLERRTTTFRDAVTVLASTPTSVDNCKITREFLKSDQRKFFVECPDCHTWADITPERLVFEPGKPEGARLACPHCGALHDEAQRQQMIAHGEFRPTAKGEPGVVGFHINALGSPFKSLKDIAQKVDSVKTAKDKQDLYTLWWGLPYQSDAALEVESSALMQRAVKIEAPYNASIKYVTCAIDVQLDRLELLMCGHASNNVKWLLERKVLLGRPAYDEVWRQADSALASTYRTRDGRKLPIAATFVDAGDGNSTDNVVRFCYAQRSIGRNVHPIFGRKTQGQIAWKWGSKVRGLMRAIIIGVDGLKSTAMSLLNNHTDQSKNYVHLPDAWDAPVYDQFTAEVLVEKTDRKGYTKRQWQAKSHARNEMLDLLVYNLAAGLFLGENPQTEQDVQKQIDGYVESSKRLAENLNAGLSSRSQ